MTTQDLKFTGRFHVGERIKAFDFKPMSDRPDQFVCGDVIDDDNFDQGYRAYMILCDEDAAGHREGEFVYVPHEVSFLEYDNRIQAA